MDNIKETKEFWNDSAKGYSNNIQSELRHDERKIWTELILENSPKKEQLRILDIGTGPGFFAIILSNKGHKVTGIDCSEDMLKEARANAEREGVKPEFVQMDTHRLNFPDETFDLVVSRNVTWTLCDPMKAYAEWKRVLKPGGRILIFDANWYMHNFDKDIERKFRRGIKRYRKKYGQFPPRFALYRKDEYWKKLPMIGTLRPLWDKAALWKLDFQDIVVDDNLASRVEFDDIDTMLYGSTPMFMVRGTKPGTEQECRQEMLEYWDGQAPACGVAAMRKLQSEDKAYLNISKFFPEGTEKVLDVGVGAGALAVPLAKIGYDVTGVDFSALMLEETECCAKENNTAVTLVKSDVDGMPFSNDEFDVLICKDIIWLMQHPGKAIKEWKRILKPGGRIVIEDKNRYLHYRDEELRKKYEEKWKYRLSDNINIFYGIKHPGASVMDKLADRLPLSFAERPKWDRDILMGEGFHIINEERIPETEYDIEAFIIAAEKKI